jgi:uncharacterized membrane protein required for colicin V production
MLDLALLLILLFGFFVGLKRGLILQIVHLTGFIVSFIVAYLYYDNLAPKLKLWVPYPSLGGDNVVQVFLESSYLEGAYYRAVAFASLFFATKIIMQIIGSMLDFLAHLPVLKQINGWAGGLLGLIEVYFIVFIILYIGALIPMESVQSAINDSFLAKTIVKHTPIISAKIKDLWFDYVSA